MKALEITAYGETDKVYIYLDNYVDNGNIYIGLVCEDGEPYADLTVNLDYLPCTSERVLGAVDTNNCHWAKELIEKYELGIKSGYTLRSGFCEYPIYCFDIAKLKEYEKEN